MKYLFLIAMAVFLLACDNNGENGEGDQRAQILALDRETMEIHDEVMPLIDDMQRVSRELRAVRAELVSHPELDQLEIRLAETDNAVDFINRANDAMMIWMQEYRVYATVKDKPDEELLEYYTTEKERITIIGNMMNESYQRGETVLDRMRKLLETDKR